MKPHSGGIKSFGGSWMKKLLAIKFLLAAAVLNPLSAHATTERQEAYRAQATYATNALLHNLSERDIAPGAVIASPSRSNPDYFYHWVRDAALTMESLRRAYERTTDPAKRERYLNHLLAWVEFERGVQLASSDGSHLGEPKYYVSGKPFTGPWGRPQNDGPAARAITMIRLAENLLAEGKQDLVRSKLYGAEFPARSPIKMDLEYTAHHWDEAAFDLWEEVKGHHFYTRMLQRTALKLGASFAYRMGDPYAAEYYEKQVALLEESLLAHKNASKNLIEPTLNQDDGWTHKRESLDVAIVLGTIHAGLADGFFTATNEWVLSSADVLERRFREIYTLNRRGDLGTAIGRYPEDVYDGNGFSGGNPWFISTHAYAELYCNAAEQLQRAGKLDVTTRNQKFFSQFFKGRSAPRAGARLTQEDPRFQTVLQGLRKGANAFFDRALTHKATHGSMWEQFSRHDGYMRGAPDLSWSYASYLTAYMSCFSGSVD